MPWTRLIPAKLHTLRLVELPGHLLPCRVQACIFAQGVICVLLYESHSSGGFVTGRVFGRTRCIQHSFKSAKPCRQVGSSHLLISSAHLVCPARMFVSSVHLVFPARMFLSPAHLVCPARMFLSPADLAPLDLSDAVSWVELPDGNPLDVTRKRTDWCIGRTGRYFVVKHRFVVYTE